LSLKVPATDSQILNPNVTVQLIVTGDWALPVREAEAANALVDAGCDAIALKRECARLKPQWRKRWHRLCCKRRPISFASQMKSRN
jgi:hypothetical protein